MSTERNSEDNERQPLLFSSSSNPPPPPPQQNYSVQIAANNNPSFQNTTVNSDEITTCYTDSSDTSISEDTHQSKKRTTNFKVWILTLACVICFVVVRVDLPVYSQSTSQAGGDVFTVLLFINLWFPIVLAAFTILYKALWDGATTLLPVGVKWRVLWLMGLLTLLNGFCSTFGSLPSRTPPYLQGLLMTMRIPFTVLLRLAILRKGISFRRLGCTVAVLIGIFITVEPQIWSLPGSAGNGSTSPGGSSVARIVWPLIFAAGFFPAAANAVICERELKQGQAQSLSFITWSLFFQLLTMLPLFWVDFIPYFGMAKSFEDFADRMRRGFACNFSLEDHCYGLPYKGWIFIVAFCAGNLFQFLLIQHAEGAVFAAVVQSMVTPLATLFWTFFDFDLRQDLLYWRPVFTETTGFTVGGLLVIVPAVGMYNVFSRWDAAVEEEKLRQMAGK